MDAPATWPFLTKEERVERVKAAFVEDPDRSTSDVAKLLGAVSRNAVIGLMRRNDIKHPCPRRKLTPRQRSRRPRRPDNMVKGLPEQPTFIAERPSRANAWKPLPGTTPQRDISKGQCKWPIGDPLEPDFGFCGCEAVEDQPYCQPHLRLAHKERISK